MVEPLLLAHAVVTILMTGIVVFVAVVHYPLFAVVGSAEFPEYEARHLRRTTLVVLPLMLAELALALLLFASAHVPRALASPGLGLLLLIWATTLLASVPVHAQLQLRRSAGLLQRQIRWHWLRTTFWCARAALAIELVAHR